MNGTVVEAGYRGGCRPGMRVPAGEPGCRADCGHRRIVEEWWLGRHAQLERAEAAGAGVPRSREWRAFFRHRDAPQWSDSEEPLTFYAWLKGLRRDRDELAPGWDPSIWEEGP